jgi:RimJ/RimL family protein N-acetyltransferase
MRFPICTQLQSWLPRGVGLTWCIANPADDRCLGSISLDGLGGYATRCEIGYWAHPDARGRGVVTEAVRLVTNYAKNSALPRRC